MTAAMGDWTADYLTGQAGSFHYSVASRTGLSPATSPSGHVTLGDLDMAWWAEGAPNARQPVSSSDLAHAIQSNPDRAFAELDGEYAFAHWDPDRTALTLGRDGVGVRPLYYLHEPGQFVAFASLLPGVIASGLVQHAVNMDVMAKLATSNYATGPETQFTRIHRVMPGHTITITPDRVEQQCHWQLICRDPIRPSDDRTAVMESLRDKIDCAIQRRIPKTGPVVAHLSGGLDSSSISALAARALASSGQRLRTYAFVGRALPEGIPVIDERPAINAVTDAYPNIDLLEVRSPDHEMLAHGSIDPFFPTFDGPTDLYEQVVRDAAAAGATSILGGYGGDEVVSYAGTGGFAELFVKGRWVALWSIIRKVARRSGRPAWRILASELRRFVLPRLLPNLRGQALGRNAVGIRQMNNLLNTKYQDLAYQNAPELRPDMAWLRAQRIGYGHIFWIQEQAAHVAGMHGVRYSSPLLDRDVLEYAIRLPPEFLHIDGLMRAGLREPMKGILPDAARMRRTKLHFDAADSLIFARDVEAVCTRLGSLEETAAAELFQLSQIRKIFENVPAPEAVLRDIDAAAQEGKQHFLPSAIASHPLLLARFVDAASSMLKGSQKLQTNGKQT